MDMKKDVMSPQLKALKKTDLSPFIRMGGVMVPRMLGGFLKTLDPKQKKAFDKVMPVNGQKKFYTHLVGTPTPPIVIEMAQPLKMSVMPECEIKKLAIKGIKLSVEDLQVITEGRIGKILWRLKGKLGTMVSLSGMFMPIIMLGPGGIKDLKEKAMTHFKPLMDMLPGAKRY